MKIYLVSAANDFLEEIADAIVFFAKNDAVCGEVLTIDGGMCSVSFG